MINDPFAPWVYELGNSWLSTLALCVVIILVRFFATEVHKEGVRATYARQRVKFALSICAVLAGEAGYRAWTWWGRLCANTDQQCSWMAGLFWPVVPGGSIALQVVGLLCMIRVLSPGVWGKHAWKFAAVLSLVWSLWWFSGWSQVLAYFGQ